MVLNETLKEKKERRESTGKKVTADEMEHGKFYVRNEFIIQYRSNTGTKLFDICSLDVCGTYFGIEDKNPFNTETPSYYNATLEEIAWLKACKEKNKFVDYLNVKTILTHEVWTQ